MSQTEFACRQRGEENIQVLTYEQNRASDCRYMRYVQVCIKLGRVPSTATGTTYKNV